MKVGRSGGNPMIDASASTRRHALAAMPPTAPRAAAIALYGALWYRLLLDHSLA